MKKFFVDSSVWMNIIKKESNPKGGSPLHKLAEDFFDKADKQDDAIYYSGPVLKEIKFRITEESFSRFREHLRSEENYHKIRLTDADFKLARKIESELHCSISFFDVLHIVLSKREGAVLISRDNKQLRAAEKYGVIAKRPEEEL
ncbi:PIN domain-containing protein [archaeon]|nr:PIN domain-containing protein [archaeon]